MPLLHLGYNELLLQFIKIENDVVLQKDIPYQMFFELRDDREINLIYHNDNDDDDNNLIKYDIYSVIMSSLNMFCCYVFISTFDLTFC